MQTQDIPKTTLTLKDAELFRSGESYDALFCGTTNFAGMSGKYEAGRIHGMQL